MADNDRDAAIPALKLGRARELLDGAATAQIWRRAAQLAARNHEDISGVKSPHYLLVWRSQSHPCIFQYLLWDFLTQTKKQRSAKKGKEVRRKGGKCKKKHSEAHTM